MSTSKPIVKPNSQEAEMAVIGSAMIDPNVVGNLDLKPSDFYNLKNGAVWECIIDMRSKGTDIDPLSISEYLKDANQFDYVGGYDRLNELQDSVFVASHSQHYAKIVKNLSLCRSEIDVLQGGLSTAYAGKSASTGVMSSLTGLFEVKRDDLPIEVHAENYVEQCKQGDVGHLSWWCDEWTAALGRLSTELVILHAPRSTGKTAMMLQWITETHRAGQVAPLVSIEMLKKSLAPRFVANIGQVSTFTMKSRGSVTLDEENKSSEAIKEIRALDIRIREDEASIDDIFQYAINENNRKKLDAIWIDNLLCINDGEKQYQSKTIMYDAFIKKFRELRNLLQCPVFILAHPNAEGNIAWSKDVENIADVIIYLEQVKDEGIVLKETGTQIHRSNDVQGKHVIAKFQKCRDGKQPVASLDFVGSTQTFYHMKWEYEG